MKIRPRRKVRELSVENSLELPSGDCHASFRHYLKQQSLCYCLLVSRGRTFSTWLRKFFDVFRQKYEKLEKYFLEFVLGVA